MPRLLALGSACSSSIVLYAKAMKLKLLKIIRLTIVFLKCSSSSSTSSSASASYMSVLHVSHMQGTSTCMCFVVLDATIAQKGGDSPSDRVTCQKCIVRHQPRPTLDLNPLSCRSYWLFPECYLYQ